VCFIGHTHRPLLVGRLRDEPSRTFWTHDARVDLSEWQRVLVNVGSVGQPRDDDPRAAVAIYDTESDLYRLLRVPYDIEREQQRILRAGLPGVLAERLALGF
jgi:diadenosine tetraphosphatase ApaH/serine/threonine PP2A family protein phosphatase